jgi:prepilin-type N-terminal cleavage/methylation domain-containing protein
MMPHSRPPSRRAGVTLIELMLVIVIIGALAAIALPRANVASFDADAGARGVGTAFQRAQRIAMQRQVTVNVAIDTLRQRIRIVEDSNANGVIEAIDRVTWLPLGERVRFAATPPAVLAGAPTGTGALRGSALRTVLGLPSVNVMRHGAVTGDVVVYLQSRTRGRLETRAVSVALSTGRADIFRYVNGAWRRGAL